MGEIWVSEDGLILENVHDELQCLGQYCVLHDPSEHHMREWKLIWRQDIRLFERICPHGIGHPDPDDLAFKERVGLHGYGTHGCDGCCQAPEEQ